VTIRIGPYLVIERLGEGGIGEVFLAQRDGDARLCALKRLMPERLQHGSARARIHREAHVATFLDHPYIASVYGAGEEEGSFCIAAELVPGQDVFNVMARLHRDARLLEPRFGLAIGISVLEALAYAHDAIGPDGAPIGLVHRDLSPRNIMVSYAGQVKVIDFGVARANIDEFRTEVGMLVGSPNYVSPEQVDGAGVDRRSDLYSLTAVLSEMLTGQNVASGANVFAVLRKVITDVAPPASSLNPTLPRELDPVLARGLAKDPEERWPDAKTYLAALQPIASRIGVAGRAELGLLVRGLFPQEEEKAAQLITEARARVDAEPMEETRAAFWEGTIVRTKTQALPRPRRKRMRWATEIGLAVSAIVAALIAIPNRAPAPPPVAPAIEMPSESPRAVERPIERKVEPKIEPKIERTREPAPVVRAKKPPPSPVVEPPPPVKRVERSKIERQLDALKRQGAEIDDPEMQAFAAELERLASGNELAEKALKNVTLCSVARSCTNERLYRVLDEAVAAIVQLNAALEP
jgi:serine/threonine-protein kinase